MRNFQAMRPAMGSFVVIEAIGLDATAVPVAMEQAFAEIATLEQQLHPTQPGSDLAHPGWQQPGVVFDIGLATWDILKLAIRLHELSGGLFDPCLPSLPGCLRDVELLANGRVRCHAPLALDLGGIAKGHAIDMAVARLLPVCSQGLVNAGGDVRAWGAPVPIWLRGAASGQVVSLHNAALAVSEAANPLRPAEHRGYYSRLPGAGLRLNYVAVKAPQAVLADALTKVAMLADPEQLPGMLRHCAAELVYSIH